MFDINISNFRKKLSGEKNIDTEEKFIREQFISFSVTSNKWKKFFYWIFSVAGLGYKDKQFKIALVIHSKQQITCFYETTDLFDFHVFFFRYMG